MADSGCWLGDGFHTDCPTSSLVKQLSHCNELEDIRYSLLSLGSVSCPENNLLWQCKRDRDSLQSVRQKHIQSKGSPSLTLTRKKYAPHNLPATYRTSIFKFCARLNFNMVSTLLKRFLFIANTNIVGVAGSTPGDEAIWKHQDLLASSCRQSPSTNCLLKYLA